MDSDLNGVLDVEEFREAMRKAEHELSGSVVSKVLDAMDVHGRLTLDQFLAIAEVLSQQHEALQMHVTRLEASLYLLCVSEMQRYQREPQVGFGRG